MLPRKSSCSPCAATGRPSSRSLRSGANGYVLKSDPANCLVDALDEFWRQHLCLTAVQAGGRLFDERGRSFQKPYEQLSARDTRSSPSWWTDSAPKISPTNSPSAPSTVSTYRLNLMNKLNIHDLPGLVKFAIREKPGPAGLTTGVSTTFAENSGRVDSLFRGKPEGREMSRPRRKPVADRRGETMQPDAGTRIARCSCTWSSPRQNRCTGSGRLELPGRLFGHTSGGHCVRELKGWVGARDRGFVRPIMFTCWCQCRAANFGSRSAAGVLKTNSVRWVRDFPGARRHFGWQEQGYGATVVFPFGR